MYHSAPRPEINWDTGDGRWVGIWGYDWLDLIGKEVLKLTDEFSFEIWQPDLRADRIYSHTFPNGMVHKLFPAEQKVKLYGMKKTRHTVSPVMYSNLISEAERSRIILRIGIPSYGINRDILNLGLLCPKITQYFAEFKGPLQDFFKFKKNMFAKFNVIRENFFLKELLNKTDVITCTSDLSINNLKKYSANEIQLLSIGIDFDFWKRRENKNEIKKSLQLDHNKYILLSSSRLNALKQVDKVIRVLDKLSGAFDFLFVVAGHGTSCYEKYLMEIAGNLIRQGKLRFVGYVPDDEKLRDYYNAADLFVMSSDSEGGPTSTTKAMAMEVPVLSTNTGQMSELLRKHDAGVVVPINDCNVWERELGEILNGKKPRILDRDIVRSITHWPFVASQYIELYSKLFAKYYACHAL